MRDLFAANVIASLFYAAPHFPESQGAPRGGAHQDVHQFRACCEDVFLGALLAVVLEMSETPCRHPRGRPRST